MFKIDNITFAYEDELALDGISLHIKKGEWWSIIGSNGSGKSTLARHLNGLLQPMTGSVLTGGLDVAKVENHGQIRRQVGFVFQNPDNQIIGTTVEEDVAFGPENIGVPREEIRERITNSLGRVGLAGFENRSPNTLSGGQKQRLAIAGALAMFPEALIIDEATAMLDPKGCQEVYKVLSELHADGMTIVMITHNMSEVVMSDHVAVMCDGRLAMVGSPREVFAQTENLEKWHIELPLITRLGLMIDGCEPAGHAMNVADFCVAVAK